MGWKHYMLAKAKSRQDAILQALPSTQSNIAKITNLPVSTVHRNLQVLIASGDIEVLGEVDNPRGGPKIRIYQKREQK